MQMPEIVHALSESLPGDTAKAIIMDAGSNAHLLPASDDGSVGPVEIGFPVNFLGKFHTTLYINTNGNVTFGGPLYKYLPFEMKTATVPIIAPFLADVDTQGVASGRIRHGTVVYEGHVAFCVNWIAVGYHQQRTDKLNSFQLLLVDRNDTGLGDFDIVLNYNRLSWESGASTGGSGGLNGRAAAAGLSAGTGALQSFFEFTGSRTPGGLLDTNPKGLARTSTYSSIIGRHTFRMRRGKLEIPWPAGRSEKLHPRLVRLNDGTVLAHGGYNSTTDVFVPATTTWRATGNSVAARRHHTATMMPALERLPDGYVLLTGGADDGSAPGPGTSELYDPREGGTFKAGPPMTESRVQHTATLLDDTGTVLVAGGKVDGTENPGRRASAELYLPEPPGSWKVTGTMTAARSGHTATLVTVGDKKMVLVAGGESSNKIGLTSAELYDIASGTWIPTGKMNIPRYEHTATLVTVGDKKMVLVAGGGIPSDSKGTAELYDPATGTWTVTGAMSRPRGRHAAVQLKTGHVLVMGGYHDYAGILAEVEMYDPRLGTWTIAASMQVDREYHDAILLDDGRILIVGGRSNAGQGTYEIYRHPFGR
jgi:hypothetical protein